MASSCILSLTASGHGFSGAVCQDGVITVATSLERITRVKNDILLPISKQDLETFGWNDDPKVYEDNIDLPFDLQGDYSAVDFNKVEKLHLILDYLFKTAGIDYQDIDVVVYSYRHTAAMEKFFVEKNPNIQFIVPEHHFSHACQAYLSSPFDEAAIMIVDGQGVPMARTNNDQLSGCLAHGRGNSIETLWELPVKYSLGGMYGRFTKKLGFKTNEEGKTMGLAAYGNPEYYDILKKQLKFESKVLNFSSPGKLLKSVFSSEETLYKLPRLGKFLDQFKTKTKQEPYTQEHKDLAYAVQKLTEDVMVFLANWLHEKTKSKNLCIAGGVGLNCVANYQVLDRSDFENIYVHPNPGDNGMAVGQALYAYNILAKNPRKYIAVSDYLGKEYSEKEIKQAVDATKVNKDIVVQEFSDLNDLYDAMAEKIEAGNITSWFQGRSEFGPRALGNRSILADPRRKEMKDILNSRVKFRESFRPFTPSVLVEKSSEYFTLDLESPFMLLAPYVKPGKAEIVPSITHADNTARVQTVSRDVNERYYDLIKAFERRTGVPMVLDTSFNVADEPIVETPEDAVRCFLSTDIDHLGIGNYLLSKKQSNG